MVILPHETVSLPLLVDAGLSGATAAEVLPGLAALWRRTCGLAACACIVDGPDHWHWAESAEDKTSPASRLSRGDDTPTADRFHQRLRALVSRTGPNVWRPFLTKDGRCLGGALTWASPDLESTEISSGWIELTGRLLEQTLRSDERLLAAKLSALAEFAAGAGHEINNPLTAIIRYAQLLQRDESDPERLRGLQVIGGQAYRIRDMIGDVMLFARPPQPAPQRVDVAVELDRIASRFAEDCRRCQVRWSVACPEGLSVWADPVQFAVVISELVRNALQASSPGGSLAVEASESSVEGRRQVRIAVRDTGRALTELERSHLFDPFFSGRQAGRGLGFGLSKCWRIITAHSGSIEVSSTSDGTQAVTLWPTGPADASATGASAADASATGTDPSPLNPES